jgi:hypothetical protein
VPVIRSSARDGREDYRSVAVDGEQLDGIGEVERIATDGPNDKVHDKERRLKLYEIQRY